MRSYTRHRTLCRTWCEGGACTPFWQPRDLAHLGEGDGRWTSKVCRRWRDQQRCSTSWSIGGRSRTAVCSWALRMEPFFFFSSFPTSRVTRWSFGGAKVGGGVSLSGWRSHWWCTWLRACSCLLLWPHGYTLDPSCVFPPSFCGCLIPFCPPGALVCSCGGWCFVLCCEPPVASCAVRCVISGVRVVPLFS